MAEQCLAYTVAGRQCKLKAVTKSHCRVHSAHCRDLMDGYKAACNIVWNRKCTTDMTEKELKEIVGWAEECHRLRIQYAVDCCNSEMDEGHVGAIERMLKIAGRCSRELEERRKFVERHRRQRQRQRQTRWAPKAL